MRHLAKPLEIIVYQDVLCAWCYVAQKRLDVLRRELGPAVRWKLYPFPLLPNETLPSTRELGEWVKEVDRARKEPEGVRLSADLWSNGDPPRCSVPALTALEAAKRQGSDAQLQLAESMQRAALELGLNVTRRDITFELASSVGLDMHQFVQDYRSSELQRQIRTIHRVAAARGVRGVPALVIGGRWILSGLRDLEEYRTHILQCLTTYHFEAASIQPGERILH